ncbi:hypothetical protein TNCV_1052221, partial [Trichonephila clavipes]
RRVRKKIARQLTNRGRKIAGATRNQRCALGSSRNELRLGNPKSIRSRRNVKRTSCAEDRKEDIFKLPE